MDAADAGVEVAFDGPLDCGEPPNAAIASNTHVQIAATECLVIGPQFYLGE